MDNENGTGEQTLLPGIQALKDELRKLRRIDSIRVAEIEVRVRVDMVTHTGFVADKAYILKCTDANGNPVWISPNDYSRGDLADIYDDIEIGRKKVWETVQRRIREIERELGSIPLMPEPDQEIIEG